MKKSIVLTTFISALIPMQLLAASESITIKSKYRWNKKIWGTYQSVTGASEGQIVFKKKKIFMIANNSISGNTQYLVESFPYRQRKGKIHIDIRGSEAEFLRLIDTPLNKKLSKMELSEYSELIPTNFQCRNRKGVLTCKTEVSVVSLKESKVKVSFKKPPKRRRLKN